MTWGSHSPWLVAVAPGWQFLTWTVLYVAWAMESGTLPMLGLGDALQFGLHQPAAGQICCYSLWPRGFRRCRGLHRALGKLIFQVLGVWSVTWGPVVKVQRLRGLAQTPTRPIMAVFPQMIYFGSAAADAFFHGAQAVGGEAALAARVSCSN